MARGTITLSSNLDDSERATTASSCATGKFVARFRGASRLAPPASSVRDHARHVQRRLRRRFRDASGVVAASHACRKRPPIRPLLSMTTIPTRQLYCVGLSTDLHDCVSSAVPKMKMAPGYGGGRKRCWWDPAPSSCWARSLATRALSRVSLDRTGYHASVDGGPPLSFCQRRAGASVGVEL
nr:predicted protein [Mycena chlorophos]